MYFLHLWQAGLGWAGLGWAGLGWAGLGWAVGSHIEEKRSIERSHVFVIFFLFIIEYKYSKKL